MSQTKGSRTNQGGLRIRRARVLVIVLGCSFGFAALSEVRLQAFARSGILARAGKSHHFVLSIPEPAKRGPILGSDGQALAEDQPLSRLTLTFKDLPKVPGFFGDLGVATGIPESQLESAAQGSTITGAKGVEWELPLSAEQTSAVMAVRSRWDAGGLGIERAFGRRYPLGSMASGIVGDLGVNGGAAEGLEGAYDQDLKGINGVKVGLVDRGGGLLPGTIGGRTRERQDGSAIETTIDSSLQAAAAQAIKEAVESHKADHGAVVIMDPTTGDVLAAANWPSYDPQPIAGATPLANSSHLDLNYMGRIEPGSMLKVLTLAKLIDTSGMPPAIECQGMIQVAGHWIRCVDHAGNRAHGHTPPEKAISESCNVSAATWGMALKAPTFYAYLEQLGLLDKPGLKLNGEVLGHALKNPPAPKLEAANWGFGQSLTSTPFAIADALSCLANDGVRMKLRLVRRVGSKVFPPVSAGQMVTSKSANTVLRYMKGVFEEPHGTGHELQIAGYSMAGKTGTAQIANQGGQYVSNFVGFFPAEKPRYEILVMVERPRVGGYYGAKIAGPAFVALAKAVIRRYSIAPTEPIPTKVQAQSKAPLRAKP